MATKLTKLTHAAPYYLAAQILQTEKDEIPIPLLIHRILSNDPAPELNQKYHLLGCGCFECLYLIYTSDKGYLAPEDFNPAALLKSRQ